MRSPQTIIPVEISSVTTCIFNLKAATTTIRDVDRLKSLAIDLAAEESGLSPASMTVVVSSGEILEVAVR